MRKILILILSLSVILFSCESRPPCKSQLEEEPQPVVEEPIEEEPVVKTAKPLAVFTVNCPADMKEVDLIMANRLSEIASEIQALKPKTVIFTGYSAKLDSTYEEERVAEREITLIAEYLDNARVLDNVEVVVENKGASEPAESHSDISGRGANRRVVITLR